MARRGFTTPIVWTTALGLMLGARPEPAAAQSELPGAALERLRQAVPGLRVESNDTRVTRLYGKPIRLGAKSARLSAEAFVTNHAGVFGVPSHELGPTSYEPAGGAGGVPVLYDRASDRFRFRVFRYEQHRDGIPVLGAELRLLVREAPGYPVTLARSRLVDLGAFKPAPAIPPIDAAASRAAAAAVRRTGLRGQPIASDGIEGLASFTEPTPIIWVGEGPKASAPVMAVLYFGDNSKSGNRARPERWRFVADASSGRILDARSVIAFADVAGTVSGLVTSGHRSMGCEPEVATRLPYSEVSGGPGGPVYAGEDGAFTVPGVEVPSVALSVETSGSFVKSRQFDSQQSPFDLQTADVSPPGPVDFILNPQNLNDTRRAPVNAYAHLNAVRDWLLSYHSAFPVISTEADGLVDFTSLVNVTGGWCPGNAWYDPVGWIYLCAEGESGTSTFANASFQDVSVHEYGHHIVNSAMGSSQIQGPYGEGFADVIATLQSGDPGVGQGFASPDCAVPYRSALNPCLYDPDTLACSGCELENHSCGRVFSGSVWQTRERLRQSEPAAYVDIVANLVINSVLLKQGYFIGEDVLLDFLALDDDDGDLVNGTPHGAEICDGFAVHGFSCPRFCNTDLDCSDGEFCNGTELCRSDGRCSAPAAPPCLPGTVCSEQLDTCETPPLGTPEPPVLILD